MEEEEKSFIGGLVQKQTKKYGSCTSSHERQTPSVDYKVLPGDTLAGIALKCGTTIEQIKRANKLWTNDSLFLRTTLKVPARDAATDGVAPLSENFTEGNEALERNGADCAEEEFTSPSQMVETSSVSDFLDKLDSNISAVKSCVNKLEKSSSIADSDGFSFLRHTSQPPESSQSTENLAAMPETSFVNKPHAKHVRNSLRRVKQDTSDQIFEL